MNQILESLLHPSEVLALLKYAVGIDPTMKRIESQRESFIFCYEMLNKTSRSFARVIQSLDPELKHPVALFYLVLRALDTIEDDMTLDIELKCSVLRAFHCYTLEDEWNFDQSGPGEKDAPLLKGYRNVILELKSLKPELNKYLDIIVDITKRMGEGMAVFCEGKRVITMQDFDLYTHYVAGLVGIGLTGLFQESGLEDRLIGDDIPELSNQMGLFLQKINILKDFLADSQEGRLFWPEEVWRKYVSPGSGPIELARSENKNNALACSNELCANALALVPSCLEYMSRLSNPTVFHFCAIPQIMAMATFDLFYNNHDLFVKNGCKIRRGLAVKLIQNSNNMESVKDLYFDYATRISFKARKNLGKNPLDKSFEPISVACANIIKWIQIHDKTNGFDRRNAKKSSYLPYTLMLAILFTAVLMFGQIKGVE